MVKSRRQPRRWWVSVLFITVVTLLVLLVRLVEDIDQDQQPGDRFVVIKILDGDTMELQGGDRLRLLGIDTPEAGDPLYDEATQMVERLALGQTGRIEYAHRRRDKYGRLLGYLFIDTLLLNKTIIDSGYGYVYLFSDNDLQNTSVQILLEAQRSAIARRVGLWSLVREPEERYFNKSGSYRLHRPGCRSLGDLTPGKYREFSTREEGIATGLSPCRNCKP